MISYFRSKLFLIMIAFALFISFMILIYDYQRISDEVIRNNAFQIEQTEGTVIASLTTVDKAFQLFDSDISQEMEMNTAYLLDLYEENPNFAEWDFQALKETLGMDVYILNDGNKIIYTSFIEDMGLDFSLCCEEFSNLLDERRNSGEFTTDGVDIQQMTGELKKFSYMATPDKEYLIELGYDLSGNEIFTEFNFLKRIEELEDRFPSINEIRVFNLDGFQLGGEADVDAFAQDRAEAFETAIDTNESVEFAGDQTLYRYVNYNAEKAQGISTSRVVEISYNQDNLKGVLQDVRDEFLIQLFVIIAVTLTIAFVISIWVARPMHLAFHDSLTSLKNRAAFYDIVPKVLNKGSENLAFIMMDLDNFKSVNDILGHDKGDEVLKQVAECMRSILGQEGHAIRLGGDEFMMVLPNVDEQEVENTAALLIERMQQAFAKDSDLDEIEVTVSVGIALSPKHGTDIDMLYKKADMALYASKDKGKNQYKVYTAS